MLIFKTNLILSFVLLCSLLSSSIFADSVSTHEATADSEATKKRIEEIFQSLDDGDYYFEEETLGFNSLMRDKFVSPFNYWLYLGPISKKQPTTIVRIEGDTGDVRMISRILEQEKVIAEFSNPNGLLNPVPLAPKSHWISQTTTWVAPWLGVLHASYDSPKLSSGQTFFRFGMYFLYDAFMIWAGGRNWFTRKFDLKTYGGNVAAALFLPRVLASYQHANAIRGHNRAAELKYTFYVD